MKHLKLFETYLDSQNNKTSFKGGEKVKHYNYTDKRDTGKPGEVSYGTVLRVEDDKVLIQYVDDKGQKSSTNVNLNDFDKSYEIVK